MHTTQTMRFTTDEQVTNFLEGLKAGRVPADTMVNIELDLLRRHKKAFQANGPKLRFRVFWPRDLSDFFSISPEPRYAPADFRTLPPWNVKRRSHTHYSSEDFICGSGVRAREVGVIGLFCSVCGSHDTRCIYFAQTEMYLGSECEFVRGTRSEFECMQCGSFTNF